MGARELLGKLQRRKVFAGGLDNTTLARVLTTMDLTALGVGSTLGVGVYVLAGSVSKTTAGPAVVLSFLIAAVASVFAGLCYAEFGARVPRAGSAYIYSYVCVGELVAFIIGWNLILEYVIGAASVGRGLSTYIDALFDNAMQKEFRRIAPIDISFMSPYPDFFAFVVINLFSGALALGVKESTNVNNVFTVLNITVILYVIITGAFKANPDNWKIPKENVPDTAGEGGFFPFGIAGMIKGAATCFYGFVGFDCIATSGEETKNPKRAIPISIIISLTIIFLAYFGISTVLTMMWPYYLQGQWPTYFVLDVIVRYYFPLICGCLRTKKPLYYLERTCAIDRCFLLRKVPAVRCMSLYVLDADPNAPIPYVFRQINWKVAQWIVSVGAVFGLFASMIGALFPLPRIIYAMANDGLLFRFLGKVHPRFQTPVLGTLVAGLLTGVMASLFDLQHLVDMMSIGTLMAYSIVAACVMLLRYAEDGDEGQVMRKRFGSGVDNKNRCVKACAVLGDVTCLVFNLHKHNTPNKTTSSLVAWEVLAYFILCIGITAVAAHAEAAIGNAEPLPLFFLALFGFCLIFVIVSISLQPESKKKLAFKVPFVPVIPGLSILINIYLMMTLDYQTWIRFLVWMVIGFAIYFGYGIWNSSGAQPEKMIRSRISAGSRQNVSTSKTCD